MTNSRHKKVHDPEGLLDRLPLDREPQLALAEAVLRWHGRVAAPEPPAMELMALQLTGHARLVVEYLRAGVGNVAEETSLWKRLDVLLTDAEGHLAVSTPGQPSVAYTQSRARLVISLYESIDEVDLHAREDPGTS
ncbi:DUF6415 family natural product biosynthesis protein [Streptomyces erythrochromogenes]|uniref:DUF6415 family natural product biosynthesis protein n=1 Tax=Streptomyces erythrochromogenes TaxID=285574 RepID=UPI00382787FA